MRKNKRFIAAIFSLAAIFATSGCSFNIVSSSSKNDSSETKSSREESSSSELSSSIESLSSDDSSSETISSISSSSSFDSSSKHEHSFSSEWSCNETTHWHDSTCGHDVKSDEGEHVFDEGVEIDANTKYTCTVCGFSKTEPSKNRVSEEKWKEAFQNANNYRMTVSADNGFEQVYLLDGDKIEFSSNGSDFPKVHIIYSKAGDSYLCYFQTDDYWSVKESSKDEYENCYFACYGQLYNFGFSYDEFTYDLTTKSYKANSISRPFSSDFPVTNVEIKFKDGGLLQCSYTNVISNMIETLNINFKCDNFCTTKVEIPATHEHTYEDNWSADDYGHWKFTTCGHETSSVSPHEYVDGVCSICGYRLNEYGLFFCLNKEDNVYSVAHFRLLTDYLVDVVVPGTWNGLPVKSIEENAFASSANVKSIRIEEGVEEIGEVAFNGCQNLTRVELPNSLKSLGYGAFEDCRSLKEVSLGLGLEGLSNNLFKNCTSLVSITIPNQITFINDSAFEGCSNINKIILPSNLSSIGDKAFYGCSSLKAISLPDSLKTIGDYAFSYCTSLTEIDIPEYVYEIGSSVFSYCRFLISISVNPNNKFYYSTSGLLIERFSKKVIEGTNVASIPNDGSVTSIGDYAFEGRASLEDMVLPNTLTDIGKNAFKCCTGLVNLTIDCSLKKGDYLADSIFFGCYSVKNLTIGPNGIDFGFELSLFTSLETIVVEEGNPIYRTISNCLIKTEEKTIIKGTKNSAIPADPNVTKIGEFAFSEIKELTSIDIPSNIIEIGDSAFLGTGLTSITIPSTLEKIGANVFYDCSYLDDVTILGNCDIDEEAFSDATSVSASLNITIGKDVTSYAPLYCLFNAQLASIRVEEGNPKFHSSGDCLIETESKTLVLGSTNSVIPGDGSVTCIGSGAFYRNSYIEAIEIPDSITIIENLAFAFCDSLMFLVIGSGVQEIKDWAFYYSNKFSAVYYFGSKDEWNSISIGSSNDSLYGASIYFYSESEPTEEGNYWHLLDDCITEW